MSVDSGNRCLICGGEKLGIPIREDAVFRAYRALIHTSRTITGRGELNKRNYRLVVCRDDYPKYKKMRNSYVRKEFTYVGIGVVFTALMMLVSSTRLLALVYGFVLILFLYVLAQISYMPALDISEEPRSAGVTPSVKRKPAGSNAVRARKPRRKHARK